MNPTPMPPVLELRVVPGPADTRARADAWFLPGAGPAQWLAGLADCDPALFAAARVIVLPRTRADRAAAGALLIGAGAVPPHPRRQAWQARAGRVFLPAAARLDPPVDDDELRGLLIHDLLVLHPGIGAVGVAERDAVAYAGLFAPGPAGPHFDRARLAPPAPRIAGLAGIAPGDANAVVSSGGGGIGTDDPRALGPPTPGIAARAAGWTLLGLAKAGDALARGLGAVGRVGGGGGQGGGSGGGGGGGGMFGNFATWSAEAFSAAAERLMPGRLAAIERLLDLLDKDPDRGLRHALPLDGAGGAARGLSRPGARLGTHGLDFNLSGLRGGGPADVWDLPLAIRQSLTRRYRALAEQEMARGHHRRAAYIFAHLLGDFAAAAQALEAGQHHREAAVLYRERLGRPQDAARCLERGGLWDEAIALHEELGNHRAAGDCHQRVGRIDQARACWHRAAEQLIASDPLGAASLYIDPLDEPESALAVLAGAWPHHAQAGHCLGARFDLLGRLGRHVQAGDLVAGLAAEGARAAIVVEIFAGLVDAYPDDAVRAHAADAGRVLVATRIAAGDDSPPLLRLVGRLEPGDRLLARDAQAYRPPWMRFPAPALPVEASLSLLDEFRWGAAVAVEGGLVAAGTRDAPDGPALAVARLGWSGTAQYAHWHRFTPEAETAAELGTPCLLPRRASIGIHLPGREVESRTLAPADGLSERLGLLDFSRHHGFGNNTLSPVAVAMASDPSRPLAGVTALLLLADAGSMALMTRGSEGARVVALPLDAKPPYALAVLHDVVAVVADGCLLGMVWPPDATWLPQASAGEGFQGIPGLRLAMLDQAMIACVVAPDGRTIAISHDDGASVHAPAVNGWVRVTCGKGQVRPAVGFSRDGTLVVVDAQELRRYRCAPPKVEVFATTRMDLSAPPVAVVAHARWHQVAVLLADGRVIVA